MRAQFLAGWFDPKGNGRIVVSERVGHTVVLHAVAPQGNGEVRADVAKIADLVRANGFWKVP